jgi:ubiquinone/menaquinone biosynthesis C-methylase UbiE
LKFLSLEASEVGIDREGLARLFDPFVVRYCDAGDPEWTSEIRRRRRKLLKQGLKRLVGWRGEGERDKQTVMAEYERSWDKKDYAEYDPARRPRAGIPFEWRDRRMIASEIGATRYRQLLLCHVVETLKPRSVLEVGCGNGINLLLLSGRFPDVRFSGIELTEAGHRAARALQDEPELPAALASFAPLPTLDPTAFRRIDFGRGNAADLPFPDGTFDLVYSVLAVEQMERIRDQALGEMARTSRRNVLMIEPFRDVNRDFWTRLNVYRRDYFRGSIQDLPRFGLEPRLVTADFPQEVFLKACLVLADKRG